MCFEHQLSSPRGELVSAQAQGSVFWGTAIAFCLKLQLQVLKILIFFFPLRRFIEDVSRLLLRSQTTSKSISGV